eukprot:14864695-Heterocapsa_arctica.AAC.1
MMQADKHIIGKQIKQHNEGKYKPHIAGENHEEQHTNEVHTQAQHQRDDDANDTQIFGNQKDDKHETADEAKVNKVGAQQKCISKSFQSKANYNQS